MTSSFFPLFLRNYIEFFGCMVSMNFVLFCLLLGGRIYVVVVVVLWGVEGWNIGLFLLVLIDRSIIYYIYMAEPTNKSFFQFHFLNYIYILFSYYIVIRTCIGLSRSHKFRFFFSNVVGRGQLSPS